MLLTLIHLCGNSLGQLHGFTLINLRGNSIGTDGPDRTGPDQTPFKSFNTLQADRGFARSRLCTDEDGTTNNLVLYMVRNDTSKMEGTLRGLRIKREREEYVGVF